VPPGRDIDQVNSCSTPCKRSAEINSSFPLPSGTDNTPCATAAFSTARPHPSGGLQMLSAVLHHDPRPPIMQDLPTLKSQGKTREDR